MGCCKWCCIVFISIVIVLCISGGLFAGIYPYPNHASCQVSWELEESCSKAQDKLTEQLEKWSSDSCTLGQCGYKFVKSDNDGLEGKKFTSILGLSDSFNFTFKQERNCNVTGFSSSDIWWAIFDFGYNYCNLKNLIVGSNLNEDPNYKEESSNAVCTMYSLAYTCLI